MNLLTFIHVLTIHFVNFSSEFSDRHPMESPLATLLAEIFIDSLERYLPSNNPLIDYVHYRYVNNFLVT